MSDEIRSRSRRTFLVSGAAAAVVSGVEISDVRAQSTELSVSVLADALSRNGIDPMTRAMSADIKPLTTGRDTIVGPAVITAWESGKGRMTADDVRKNMFEPLDDAVPGSVWVVAGGGERMLSLFGGVIGVACKRNGIAGAVTDNACRDVATFDQAGFSVFGKTTVPFGPGTFARPVAANIPVMCGGVEVNPGDYVAADADGVIVIPRDAYADVAAAASEVLSREQRILDKIAAGESLADAYTL